MEKVAQLPLPVGTDLAELLADDSRRSHLEREILPAYIRKCRWYRSKNRKLTGVALEAWGPLPVEPPKTTSWFTVLRTFFEGGDSERYALPMSTLPGGDAAWDPLFRAALFKISVEGTKAPLGNGVLKGMPFSVGETALREDFSSQVVGGEQSNTSFVFSSGHFVKLYRRLEEGVNPESETLRFLEKVRFQYVPSFIADLTWERPNHPPVTVAMTQRRIEAKENGWEYVIRELSMKDAPISPDLLEWIRRLGHRTGELHLALGSQPADAVFAPEPLSTGDLAVVHSTTLRLLNGIGEALKDRDAETSTTLHLAISKLDQLEAAFTGNADPGNKIRCHGDLHLGQIVAGSGDIWFIDFEGEPARPFVEKRLKHSPLRDVAGMLRSFHYAAHVASTPGAAPALTPVFLEAYYKILTESGSSLLPSDAHARDRLLDIYVLEKTVYELHYELNNRPDWFDIPLQGLAAQVI